MRRIPTTYTSTQSLSLDVSHFPKFSKVLHAGDDLGDPNNIITFILFLWIIIYKFTPNCKKKKNENQFQNINICYWWNQCLSIDLHTANPCKQLSRPLLIIRKNSIYHLPFIYVHPLNTVYDSSCPRGQKILYRARVFVLFFFFYPQWKPGIYVLKEKNILSLYSDSSVTCDLLLYPRLNKIHKNHMISGLEAFSFHVNNFNKRYESGDIYFLLALQVGDIWIKPL